MTVVRLESSSKLIRLLLLGGVATALIAVPATVDGSHPGIGPGTALAKNDGGRAAVAEWWRPRQRTGRRARPWRWPGKANGVGHGYGHGGANSPDTATYGSFGEFMGKVRARWPEPQDLGTSA